MKSKPQFPSIPPVSSGQRLLRRLLLLGLLVFLIAAGFQAGDWTLGRVAMARGPSSGPLAIRGTRANVVRASFLANVGGVAFIETAAPGPSVAGRSVSIRYDAAQADGSRLAVTVGGTVYRPYIPDWQLVPIARFAASRNNAVVSLFGENGTEEFFEATYHQALGNSLLGLRLLQSDMLLMLPAEDAAQLPRQNNVTVLGTGEEAPDQMTAHAAAIQIAQVMDGHKVRSWLFTDRGESVRFGVNDGRFVITGEPYYYFWRYSRRGEAIIDSVSLVEQRYDRNVELYKGLLASLGGRPPTSTQTRQLQSYTAALRRDSLSMARLDAEFEVAGTTSVAGLTTAMRSQRTRLRDMNPAVYDAARQTMRYAAFFRWVRQNNRGNWNQFAARISGVRPRPSVVTPNRIPR